MRHPLWTNEPVWADDEKHTAGAWAGSDEGEHHVVYSAGKGPETMRQGGGGGAIANQEVIEYADSETDEGPAELYEGPQQEND